MEARETLAQLAARLLMRGEARDFAHARHKALALSGVRASEDALRPGEILTALLGQQRLFDRDAPARNEKLRRAALEAMRFLRDFEPRLTDEVLLGVSLRDTPVRLHLFIDEFERLTRFLIDRGVIFELQSGGAADGRMQDPPRIEFARGDVGFELTVLPTERARRPPNSPLTGGASVYLREEALAARLAADPAGCWLDLPGVPAIADPW